MSYRLMPILDYYKANISFNSLIYRDKLHGIVFDIALVLFVVVPPVLLFFLYNKLLVCFFVFYALVLLAFFGIRNTYYKKRIAKLLERSGRTTIFSLWDNRNFVEYRLRKLEIYLTGLGITEIAQYELLIEALQERIGSQTSVDYIRIGLLFPALITGLAFVFQKFSSSVHTVESFLALGGLFCVAVISLWYIFYGMQFIYTYTISGEKRQIEEFIGLLKKILFDKKMNM